MKKSNINFENIISKAYETLIIQDDLFFPLDIFNIKLNRNIIIVSFEEMASRSNIHYDKIKELADGAPAFIYEYDKITFIIYDNLINSIGRKRWSIAHEYGHIVLNHKKQCAQNEIEANFFAANLLLPQCILKELVLKKGDITKDYLQSKFSISAEAAERYLSKISGREFEYFKNEYDDIIITKANKFLNKEIKNSKRYQQLIDDDMQLERNNWLYDM